MREGYEGSSVSAKAAFMHSYRTAHSIQDHRVCIDGILLLKQSEMSAFEMESLVSV